MTIAQSLQSATQKLKNANIASAQLDAQLLLAHSLQQSKEYLLSHSNQKLTLSQQRRYKLVLQRRLDREPVCYITNSVEFYGLNFFVDHRVLAPRVETESIVEQTIANAKANSNLIDIGTGSGAIAIATARARPDLNITATEISASALVVAKRNAKTILGQNHKINFLHSDIFSNVEGIFDCIVTNLPYVSQDYQTKMKPEVAKEPSIALYGGSGDGLDLYRKFYKQLPKHINAGGLVYHESDPWQHSKLQKLAHTAGLKRIYEDYLVLGFLKS